ncbi:MAG: DUF922 domain-containing protein [Pseudomonadota bacterium]
MTQFKILISFLITLIPSYSLAGTYKITEKYNYYDVKGTTSEKLKRQMRRGCKKRGCWGYAQYHVRDAGNCHLVMTITYTLPEWVNYHEGTPDLKRKWDRMIAVLTRHEKTHGKHYKAGIKEAAEADCKRNREIRKSVSKSLVIMTKKRCMDTGKGFAYPDCRSRQ